MTVKKLQKILNTKDKIKIKYKKVSGETKSYKLDLTDAYIDIDTGCLKAKKLPEGLWRSFIIKNILEVK